MSESRDITTNEDIQLLVTTFYEKVGKDPLIGPIFIPIMNGGHWEKHVEIICAFWGDLLFESQSYRGNAFAPHAQLPLEKIHFDTWIKHFHSTVDEFFKGEIAQKAKFKSTHIATIFLAKIKNNQK